MIWYVATLLASVIGTRGLAAQGESASSVRAPLRSASGRRLSAGEALGQGPRGWAAGAGWHGAPRARSLARSRLPAGREGRREIGDPSGGSHLDPRAPSQIPSGAPFAGAATTAAPASGRLPLLLRRPELQASGCQGPHAARGGRRDPSPGLDAPRRDRISGLPPRGPPSSSRALWALELGTPDRRHPGPREPSSKALLAGADLTCTCTYTCTCAPASQSSGEPLRLPAAAAAGWGWGWSWAGAGSLCRRRSAEGLFPSPFRCAPGRRRLLRGAAVGQRALASASAWTLAERPLGGRLWGLRHGGRPRIPRQSPVLGFARDSS